ncbi:MAG: polysaccharide deacetylase family protein [Aquimonas sp.]|nr:polysaccharide deacetylase family protein [Aquimonas sp.]
MTASTRPTLRLSALLPLLLLWLASSAAALSPQVLLVFDLDDPVSALDARGIREALAEQRTPWLDLPLGAGQPLPPGALEGHATLVLAHVSLDSGSAAAVRAWVAEGGGLLASGRSGLGLEDVLGVSALQALTRSRPGRPPLDEIRFGVEHPVATGSFWTGPVMQVPPLPGSELPTIPQLLNRSAWPAYAASASGASRLARWRASDEAWTAPDDAGAVFAHAFGDGRSLWFGALPGVYADWEYPLAWRTPIQEGLAWLNTRSAVIQLGHWPQGARAAYAFTADTESAAMRTAVPALLDIFARLGLAEFGTFFLLGQSGGQPGTEGAVENPQVVQALLAAGTEIAGHGDIHVRFEGQSEAVQAARLAQMRQLIENSAPGVPPLLGFRAPNLALGPATWRATASAGLAYDSSDQDVWCECSLPWWTGEVWSLPPSAPMDFILLDEFEASPAQFEALMVDKARFMASRRGLFNWVTHPWVLEGRTAGDMSGPPVRPHVLAEVEAILARARDDGDFWMQRLDTILAWWLQREDLRLELLESTPSLLRLRLHNDGDTDVAGATLWLRPIPSEYPWAAFMAEQPLPLLTRAHGLGAPQDYRLAVLPLVAAESSVELELRLQLPEALFANGFEQVPPLQSR